MGILLYLTSIAIYNHKVNTLYYYYSKYVIGTSFKFKTNWSPEYVHKLLFEKVAVTSVLHIFKYLEAFYLDFISLKYLLIFIKSENNIWRTYDVAFVQETY